MVLSNSCKRDHDTSTLTNDKNSITLHTRYDFDKFYYSSNSKGDSVSGYFQDLVSSGILNCVSGSYHPSIRQRISSIMSDTTIVDSAAVELENEPDPTSTQPGSVEEDVYISSAYAEPFNSVNGWTLSYWFKTDTTHNGSVLDVRDDSVFMWKGNELRRNHYFLSVYLNQSYLSLIMTYMSATYTLVDTLDMYGQYVNLIRHRYSF